MDEILKSEIFIAVYGKKQGVSFEDFGGVFRQTHGYSLNLINYGYSSLRSLLNDMNDLVEIKVIKGNHMIRCKSPSRHHVVVSEGNHSIQANDQVSGLSSVDLPSVGPSQGPVIKKTEQAQPSCLQQNQVKVNSTSSAAVNKASKETPKSKCPTPAKKTDPAVRHRNNSKPIKVGSSLNEKTATLNKTTKSHKPARPKPPVSKPVHAKPTGNVATAASTACTNNTSKTGQESNSKSNTNLTSLQDNRPTETRSIERWAFSATSEQNKKSALLPTPKAPLTNSQFYVNYKLPIALPGILPIMSYASVCANNINRSNFNHNGQQCTPNNIKFNVDTRVNSTNVKQANSRAESRTPIQSSFVIKKNIQELLSQHADGLSVFQLQKKYLFTFQQPLKFRGSNTLKQLLMELKDVVKTEGVGVQMLVFPVPAKNNQTTNANGEHDAALHVADPLSTKKDFQRETVLNRHSLRSNNDELQEPAQLHLHDGQISTPRQHQMDSIEGHTIKVVKTEKQPTLQIMQNVEHISFSAHQVEFPREQLSFPAPIATVLPNQINGNPLHKGSQSVQMPHEIYQSHGQKGISSLCKNVIMKDAPITNEPSQISPQVFNSPQVILHSSGFSFLMGQQIDRLQNKVSEISLDKESSLTEQEATKHKMLKGPEHSGPYYRSPILPITNSSMLLHDTKPHHLPNLPKENTDHLLVQLHNSMKTYGQTELTTLPPMGDFQSANNRNIKCPPSHSPDHLQTKTFPAQKENPSLVQKNTSQIVTVEQATCSSSNSQKKAPDSQIINNFNASTNEKAIDALTNVIEKTSQPEVSGFPPTNDPDKANTRDLYVDGTEQATCTLLDVDKVVNGKSKQKNSTLQQQFDECTAAERITETTILSSKPRQEIVDSPQNIPNHLDIVLVQSELQNNLESVPEQEEITKTWQTSQEQVCCIL